MRLVLLSAGRWLQQQLNLLDRLLERPHAWSSPVEGSVRRLFYAVLHLGGIRSPLDAVRAAIVAEHRESA
jgi:hypothetical protein